MKILLRIKRHHFLQKTYWIPFIIAFLPILAFGQNVNFTQFHLSPAQTNPAGIITSNQKQVIFNFRNQFIGYGQAFNTPMISYLHPYIKKGKKKLAFGVSILQDRTGDGGALTTTGGIATVAYQMPFGNMNTKGFRNYFSVGLQGGYFQRRINYEGLSAGVQWTANGYDRSVPIGEQLTSEQKGIPSFNGGLLYYRADSCANVQGYFGVTVQNILRPNVSLFSEQSRLSVLYNIQGGWTVYNNGVISIQPNFRWLQEQQTNQIRAGALAYYHAVNGQGMLKDGKVGLGAWYDENGTIAFGIEFHQKNLMLAMGYDMGATSNNKTLGSGAFELSVGLKFGKKCIETPPKDTIPDVVTSMDTMIVEKENGDTIIQMTLIARIDVKTNKALKVDTIKVVKISKKFLEPTDEDLKIFKNPAFFYYLSYEVNASTKKRLDKIAEVMNKFKGIKIVINGHSCNIGRTEDKNQKLSVDRAETVRAYLMGLGVEMKRIEVKGFGSQIPILSNEDEYGRTKNRRVEFSVISTGQEKK